MPYWTRKPSPPPDGTRGGMRRQYTQRAVNEVERDMVGIHARGFGRSSSGDTLPIADRGQIGEPANDPLY